MKSRSPSHTGPIGLSGFVPEGREDLSRRDDRTQPGVLTPGYRCKKRPALKGQKIVKAELGQNRNSERKLAN